MRDFDKRQADFDKRFAEQQANFDKMARRGKIIAAILLPLYGLGILLVLGLLAVALYGLAHVVGLL